MQVPVLDQSVGVQTQPQEELKAPSVNPNAFGENVATAIKGLGEAGTQASDALIAHVERENFYRDQAKIANTNLDIKNKFQDMMNSTDPVPVQGNFSNTAPVDASANADAATGIATQPKGYLNRFGFNANGVTQDFADNAEPMLNEAMQQFKGNAFLSKQAQQALNETFSSYYDQVSKHEAVQYRQGMNNTFNAQTASDILSASSAVDPNSLAKGIQNITASTNQEYGYKGADADQTSVALQKNIGDAVGKAASNTLISTGNLAQAQSLLDSAKDKMSETDYENTTKHLVSLSDSLQRQAHMQDIQNQVQNRTSIISQIANNKIDLSKTDDIAAQIGPSDPELATAVKAAGNSKNFGQIQAYSPEDDKNQPFSDVAQSIFAAKSQKEVGQFLVKALHETSNGDISQDRLNILVNAAMMRSKALPLGSNYDTSFNSDPNQQEKDAAFTSLAQWQQKTGNKDSNTIFDFLKGLVGGKSGNVAQQQAIQNSAIRQYPAAASMDTPPNMVIPKNSSIRVIFPRTNRKDGSDDGSSGSASDGAGQP